MLLFEFYRGQINKEKHGAKKQRNPGAACRAGETERGDEGTEIQRVARERVWARIGQLLILAQVPGGPGPKRESAE